PLWLNRGGSGSRHFIRYRIGQIPILRLRFLYDRIVFPPFRHYGFVLMVPSGARYLVPLGMRLYSSCELTVGMPSDASAGAVSSFGAGRLLFALSIPC